MAAVINTHCGVDGQVKGPRLTKACEERACRKSRTAFEDSIVSLYAGGRTVHEIQGYPAESYRTEVPRPGQHGDRQRVGAWLAKGSSARDNSIAYKRLLRCRIARISCFLALRRLTVEGIKCDRLNRLKIDDDRNSGNRMRRLCQRPPPRL